jgi:hypothetical protein
MRRDRFHGFVAVAPRFEKGADLVRHLDQMMEIHACATGSLVRFRQS